MSRRRDKTSSDRDTGSPDAKRRKEDDGSHPIELTHSDYTVGWLCALPKEQTAAKAMLDQIHPDLRKPTNDSNAYTLGSIAEHNIVIACLPKGKIGTNAAATFATQMVRTFPSIKVGLMVGIGGGIPPQVRLGDVVVSTPTGQYPGVVQWDLGKAERDGMFKRTGALNNPPSALLTALTKLETDHDMVGSRIPEYLEELKQKWPRLVPKYIRSELHQDPVTSDTSDRITGDVQVHYGLIASGNQVIKDAEFRDTLNKSLGGNVLCVEMEAAGLMDFPCIVIRGICDYADSQKNDHWQEHAAAVGAAFAKEFLQYVQPSDVEGERPVKDMLKDMLKQVHNEVSATRKAVMKIKSTIVNDENLKILNWLTPFNYGLQQSDYIGRRQPGTGEWLLGSVQFHTWYNTRGKTLFCPGIPGAGKTILTSIVVDTLETLFQDDRSVGIAYVYCNFRRKHEQTPNELLASLLKQLTQCLPTFPESLESLYNKHSDKHSRPSLEEISNTLQFVATLYSKVFIIIDALDESLDVDNNCMKFLNEVFKLQDKTKANIFATSRPLPDITEIFKGTLLLNIRATQGDVKEYLEGHMAELRRFVQDDQQLQENIKTGISEAVDGMFLLAQIYLDLLNDKVTRNAVLGELERMNKQKKASGGNMDDVLNKAYDTVMDRINGQKLGLKELAIQVLSWISCAKRPLNTSELQHALATKTGRSELDHGDQVQIGDMVSVCAGLVTVDEHSNIIRLAHYTTQGYFDRKRDTLFQNPEASITRVCVTYLSLNSFERGFCPSDEEFEKRIRLNAFYDYAANHWGNHARDGPGLCQEVIDFLGSKKKVESSSQALMVMKLYPAEDYSQDVPTNMTGLHLIAYFGIINGAELLISAENVNLVDSWGRTAISYATEKGHEAILKLLIDKGADIESENESGRTPLSWAAENGHDGVVRLLLDEGVDIESEDEYSRMPLSWAAENGHEAVIKLLLDKGADAGTWNDYGNTPLLEAAQNGHEAAVKLLLDKGADANVTDNYGWAPLFWAASGGYEAVITLLLDKGVDVESKDQYGQMPISWAAQKGHEAAVKLLLDKGTAIKYENESVRAPLSWAAENGHDAVVKLLLNEGADADAKDNSGKTALLEAAENGHEAVVKVLLDKGADADAKDNFGSTPLLEAARNGHEAAAKLLLDKGADANATDDYGWAPLFGAARSGHEAVIKLLLNQGADVESKDGSGRTPLSLAAENGHEAILKLLLTEMAVKLVFSFS
ncbi:hypothetical protein G7Z17_g3000 [Cylindrodendrum hubeiense]|uniref:Nucleoside phosphorylase domain-containing protein n=1 Tax=Cylindrodendrum hubeiense TaxID=595255 RepID=A0A9P5LB54_9HYPO|nr:hypothetical protein G7Z17_g3000 [Cylindrodendrum hubeiense]